jgi:hypothetical protein
VEEPVEDPVQDLLVEEPVEDPVQDLLVEEPVEDPVQGPVEDLAVSLLHDLLFRM